MSHPSRKPDPHAEPARLAPSRMPGIEREAAAWILAAFARSTTLLARSLDPDVTMLSVLEAAIPSLADWGVVCVPGDAGEAEWCQVRHADEERSELVGQLARFPFARALPAHAPDGGAQESCVVLPAPARLLAGLGASSEQAALRDLRPKSLAILSLSTGRGAPGTLALAVAESGRSFTGDDAPLLGRLGRQFGLSLHAARVFRRAEQAWGEGAPRLAALVHELKNHLHTASLALTLLSSPDLAAERRAAQLATVERVALLLDQHLAACSAGAPPSGPDAG